MCMLDNECVAIFEKQFTRFMVAVVRNGRKDYMRMTNKIKQRETLMSEIPDNMNLCADDADSTLGFAGNHGLEDSITDPVLYHAITSLTDKQREILNLFFALDMTCNEIAAHLDCSPRNVQQVKKAAISKIATVLEMKNENGL